MGYGTGVGIQEGLKDVSYRMHKAHQETVHFLGPEASKKNPPSYALKKSVYNDKGHLTEK